MKVKTVVSLPYREFEELVKHHFPATNGKYSAVAAEEWGNDEDHLIEGIKGDLDDYEREEIEQMEEHGRVLTMSYRPYPSVPAILNRLVEKGHIPAGDYLIEVSW